MKRQHSDFIIASAHGARIGLLPYSGRARNDLEEGLRMVPFEHSAVIIYRVEADRVRITNVFYGGRDYEAFYLGIVADDEPHGDA